jgi:hypothetical protein
MFKRNGMPSLADIEGPWVDPDFDSGLIQRCKRAWTKPLDELTNEELATLLRQRIAVTHVLPVAQERLEAGINDDSELYDGELASAVTDVVDNI